jgi:nitroreductase
MSFLELAQKRRSCRKYSSQSVSMESIKRCLEAARLAPSACNSQPWRFVVIFDPDLRMRAAEAAFSGMYGMNAFAKNAPVLVAVIREQSTYAAQIGSAWRGVQYSLIDLGIACDHFTLQAAEEGLGTCWLGWFNEKAVKKVLGLPGNTKIDILLSVGYPQDDVIAEKNRKALDEMSEMRQFLVSCALVSLFSRHHGHEADRNEVLCDNPFCSFFDEKQFLK